MKKALWLLPAVMLLMGLAIVVACGEDSPDSEDPTNTDAAPTGDATPHPTNNLTPRPDTDRECGFADEADIGLISYLQFGGASAAHYAVGEDVPMNLVLLNCAGVNVELFFEGEALFDFSVEDDIGQEVWRWTEEQDLSDEPGALTILPLEMVEYAVTWDQRDFSDDQVAPGVYKVYAFSLGCGMEGDTNCHFGPVELMEITE